MLPWLVARVVVAASWVAATAIVAKLQDPPQPLKSHVPQGILGWDAVRYLEIATRGYEELPTKELRFFPLFPLVVRAADWCLPGPAPVAAVVVANLAALALGAAVYALTMSETRNAAVARTAVWFAALSPAGFVLVWGYAEGVFNLLVASTLLTIRSGKWWVAAITAGLAGLTRPLGILLVVPIAVEGVRALSSRRDRRALVPIAAAAVAPLAGTAAYLYWVRVTFGDPFLPYTIQTSPSFRGAPWGALGAVQKAATSLGTGSVSLESVRVVWVVVALLLIVVLVRRWPASYGALAVASLVVALAASRLGSFERYALTTVPAALALATVARTDAVRTGLLVTFGSAMALYGLLGLGGVYVP